MVLPGGRFVEHQRRRFEGQRDPEKANAAMAELAERYDSLIIGTERGLIDRLQELYPQKTIVPLSRAAICGNMKVNTLACRRSRRTIR